MKYKDSSSIFESQIIVISVVIQTIITVTMAPLRGTYLSCRLPSLSYRTLSLLCSPPLVHHTPTKPCNPALGSTASLYLWFKRKDLSTAPPNNKELHKTATAPIQLCAQKIAAKYFLVLLPLLSQWEAADPAEGVTGAGLIWKGSSLAWWGTKLITALINSSLAFSYQIRPLALNDETSPGRPWGFGSFL